MSPSVMNVASHDAVSTQDSRPVEGRAEWGSALLLLIGQSSSWPPKIVPYRCRLLAGVIGWVVGICKRVVGAMHFV